MSKKTKKQKKTKTVVPQTHKDSETALIFIEKENY